MKKIILFTLIVFFLSCENGDDKFITISGVIVDGDNNLPMKDVKIILSLIHFTGINSRMDSTVTDDLGYYSFVIRNNEMRYTQYLALPVATNYKICKLSKRDVFTDSEAVFRMNAINQSSNNFDSSYVCETAQIDLIITKAHPNSLDTLWYNQSIKTNTTDSLTANTLVYISPYQASYYYFSKVVSETKFSFEIKKQDGLVENVNKMLVIQPKKTQQVVIEY